MMEDFTTAEIQTGETSIFVRSSGSGPPILLLHGSGRRGATMYEAKRSTPAISSRKRLPNRLPTR
jgi:hypothetical protein